MEYFFKYFERYSILKGVSLVLEKNELIENNMFLSFLTMVLGLTLSSNIIYVFSFGSTHFTVSEVYSVLLFIYLVTIKRVNWQNIFQTVDFAFKMFCILIAFSGAFAFITFFSISLLYRFIVGIISFGICLTTMVDVISLFDYRRFLARGCIIGIIINCLFCIAQYIAYQMNIPFTLLYDMFKQASFHQNIYNFCAQGLFLEPSHMNQYLASVVPICIGFIGMTKIKNKLFLIFVLAFCALSTSGTAAVVAVGLLLLLMLDRPFSRYVNKSSFVFVVVLVFLFIIIGTFFSDSTLIVSISDNVRHYIKLSIEGSNIGDSSNAERVQSMKEAIKLIPQNPLGCGWNMVHTLLQQKTDLGTASAFSDMLEMTLEIGVLGVSLYVISACNSIFACLRIREYDSQGVAVAIVCVLIMEILADYAINPCIMSILALGMCYRNELINTSQI